MGFTTWGHSVCSGADGGYLNTMNAPLFNLNNVFVTSRANNGGYVIGDRVHIIVVGI